MPSGACCGNQILFRARIKVIWLFLFQMNKTGVSFVANTAAIATDDASALVNLEI